jgi:glyoxylase-like metal-dependent hydrolase (beta-lactamase superfamily II)
MAAAAVVVVGAQQARTGTPPAKLPASVRLYVFDCGTITSSDMNRYRMKPEEVATTKLSIGCYLVAHPRGTLMWDVGAVPDRAWTPTGSPVTHRLTLPDGQMREAVLTRPLIPQIASAGYSPADITFLALSHAHWDHTGNANQFAGSQWLARSAERSAMFGTQAALGVPATYNALRTARVRTLENSEDYDVFGDGTVIIKPAPGHTPGHQVLFLKLAKTGNILLSGDLYHYPEERALGRVPTFEVDEAKTRASREAIEMFLKQTHTALWIQHDFNAYAKLKKAPEYYD